MKWAAISALRILPNLLSAVGCAVPMRAELAETGPVRVVLPTYNEAENLERIVAAILAAAPEVGGILVVDDASPDGTGEIADRMAEGDDRVAVLHRAGKSGLGPAYVAGFQRVLGEGADLVVQMDADFSHDPADVPRLIAAVRGGADLALGSRYVPGGGVGDWGACAGRSRAAAAPTPAPGSGSAWRT